MFPPLAPADERLTRIRIRQLHRPTRPVRQSRREREGHPRRLRRLHPRLVPFPRYRLTDRRLVIQADIPLGVRGAVVRDVGTGLFVVVVVTVGNVGVADAGGVGDRGRRGEEGGLVASFAAESEDGED